MVEVILHGRGGQGGVTLAKLIATAYFLKGKHTQAFGLYAAERSGAPLQAFVRIDDEEITNHNQIRTPDHVIVLDRGLLGPRVLAGMKPDGWVILNTPQPAGEYAELLAGRNVATVDATGIALDNQLGTRTVPIVNTTMLGAVGRVFGLSAAEIDAALRELGFTGGNLAAAATAYEKVGTTSLPGDPVVPEAAPKPSRIAGLLDPDIGGLPALRTGAWASRRPSRRSLTPPCSASCPAGNDIQAFVQAITKKDYTAALEKILETSPLPGVCGRVCPAPCMHACNRAELDGSVNIRDLERYVSEHGRHPRPEKPTRPEPVAVVGSGPAGLSAAYHLARLGYPVSLFESDHELGGVLRTGIPSYRLPRDVLDDEISFIVRHGVEVHTDTFIDRTQLLRLTRRFRAVFVATGLQQLRALSLGPETRDVVMQGIDFLDQARQGMTHCRGQRVVVVGGGNTAFDAARTARRLGATHVEIIYRRTRAEMPAIAEEIEEGVEEGIVLSELVNPLRLERDGKHARLTCTRMTLGEPDESGRPRPVPDKSEDAQFDLVCDRVILALGQSADVSVLPEGAQVCEGESVLGLTEAPIFSGGDLATNAGTVAHAIGSGRRAALHMHKHLTGEDLFPTVQPVLAKADKVHRALFEKQPAEHARHVPAALRRTNFREVRLGLMDEPGHHTAMLEAARCFSCGVCNECDRCVAYCPEGVLEPDDNGCGYRFNFDYCKGCGVCASQCPRGVITMDEL